MNATYPDSTILAVARDYEATWGSGDALRDSPQQLKSASESKPSAGHEDQTGAELQSLQNLLHLISTSAHDIKTPLMVISGAARMLRQDDLTPEEKTEYLDRLLRNVTSLEYLAADLTDAVASRTGKLKIDWQVLDLTELAQSVVRDYDATRNDHAFHFHGTEPCWVTGDIQRLKRVLWNLLSNAAKYSDSAYEVSVSVWCDNKLAILSVQDRGVGMSDSATERLFLPFERLDETRHMAKGSGLGLVSVLNIVDAHKGEIEIQGEEGRGTTMKLSFPLVGKALKKKDVRSK